MADDLNEKLKAAAADDKVQHQAQSDNDAKDARIEELTGQLARAMADLQNFKRRNEDEKASFVKFANAELLKIILPILDNLDRSVTHLPEELKDNEWTKGMLQIHNDLLKTFEKLGIKKIKTVGEKLNPKMHEALMAGPGEKDVIVEEFEPGYTLFDDVIKVAKVKVGDGLPTDRQAPKK
ncbi:nucleotide exchange factor GrpE [Patescibacteria group bacterium]|nr:nucleotide exchange factor GrpE [Patescibacteria group bacterium]MBU1015651.1 nucleotide exchange factor GrpE [Patescibacteria group bacterium]MBU1684774.1 nucleotide exchange factor GrpE [Patescibacteria group bacterium]MBU1938208.1 nucleotide exchange factor GrpE [Patescibacteria group bacterium]